MITHHLLLILIQTKSWIRSQLHSLVGHASGQSTSFKGNPAFSFSQDIKNYYRLSSSSIFISIRYHVLPWIKTWLLKGKTPTLTHFEIRQKWKKKHKWYPFFCYLIDLFWFKIALYEKFYHFRKRTKWTLFTPLSFK